MGKVRVLIVDDHTIFCEALKRLLEEEEFVEVVGVARSGDEAIALMDEIRPDVVLMDVQLPGLSGIQATRAIRERWPHVRVIILSMHDANQLVYEALRAGASSYVLKDASITELRTAIKNAVDGQVALSAALTEKVLRSLAAGQEGTLTQRELEVLQLVSAGLSNQQVATTLCVSVSTVKNHLYNVYQKLGCKSRAEAVRKAYERGYLAREPSPCSRVGVGTGF